MRGSAPITPLSGGQWAGPYTLSQITAEQPTPGKELSEIVHAVVLPDPDGAVLFWCRVYTGDKDPSAATGHAGSYGPTHTWLWESNSPQNVTKIDIPNALSGTQDGTRDFFCGGHQFLPNGNIITFGGTDLPSSGSTPTGHIGAAIFDLATQTWSFSANAMNNSRWYPNAFPGRGNAKNDLFILGHEHDPQPTSYAQEHHDRYSWSSNAWASPTSTANRLHPGVGNACTTNEALFAVEDYPRAHRLAKEKRIAYFELGSGALSQIAFLAVDDSTVACPSSTPPVERWFLRSPDYPPFGQGTPAAQHEEGSTAHYVIAGANGSVDYEQIYVAAGYERLSSGNVAQNEVDQIRNPNETTADWNEGIGGAVDNPPDLAHARINQNMVILADGSMLVVGGNDTASGGPSIEIPECYLPSEFGGTTGLWKEMNSHDEERRYHSVAGLLPDGRVFSAGGDLPVTSHHSIEIFSPPYLYAGSRGVVTNFSSVSWDTTNFTTYNFDVQFRAGVQVRHIGLVKTGSITHSFDSSQRYVKLFESAARQTIGTDKYRITIDQPSIEACPAGDYMLFVVSTDGVPSLATMIHVS